jgi:uncharacterized protein
VEATLNRLAEMGFARQLARQAGFKESRYAQLLGGEVAEAEVPPAEPERRGNTGPSLADRVAQLEADLTDLRRRFEDFRRNFE